MANPLAPPQRPNPLIPPGMNPQTGQPLPGVMPPPPPSPSLGFQSWASDPMNAHKVIPAMTKPDQPLQPNAGMASANPPAVQSPFTPPGGIKQNIAATQAATTAQPGADVTAPLSLPSPTLAMPASAQPPVQSQAQANLGTDTARLQQLQTQGPGVNQIKNPIGRGFAKAGDIALSILAPGISTFIPGTTMHNDALRSRAQNAIGRDQSAIQAQTQAQKDASDLAHTNAETAAIPINAGIKQQAASASLAQHGLKVSVDENGMTHVVPDEDSPVYQQQQQKEETLKAQADYMTAGIALRNAQADLAKTKSDPNSPAFKLAQQKLAVAQQNASAAGQRAQAYMGRYMQSAYNVGMDGKVLPGAATIADDNGQQTVVGTGNASLASKSQSNAAQFNDVHGALDTVENAAKTLVSKGGKLNSPGVAAALAQPSGTLGQWLQGVGVKANLSPEERQYVQAVSQAHENIQALRKSAGGTATDSAVAKLDAMIPGASTPDLNYLLGQTGQIRATAERLGKGATTAAGGLTVRGQQHPFTPPKTAAPASGTQTFTENGVAYNIPTAQVAEFKKDHPNAR